MKTINVAFPWPSDNIKTAWSGSAYQILEQLKSSYKVNVIDTSLHGISRILCAFFVKFGLQALAKRFCFWRRSMIVNREVNDGDLFTFEPLTYKKGKAYIYIDCSFSYLVHLYKTDYESYRFSNFDYSLKQLEKLASYQNRCFKSYSAIFVMGKHLELFFRENYDESIFKKVVQVGAGINVEFNENVIKKDESFLFVGKDFVRKSGDLVVEAFSIVKRKFPNATLFIVGPQKKEFECGEGIIYIGEISFEETKKYFAECKVFVMPSRFEAYGIVFLEAYAARCSVIVQNKFEMSFFSKKNGFYTCTLSKDSVAKHMIEALMNYDADHSTYTVEDNTWSSVFKKMKPLIDDETI